eukprot:scaffold20811_cov70-Cyclotella_meneghiniana.AAC.2
MLKIIPDKNITDKVDVPFLKSSELVNFTDTVAYSIILVYRRTLIKKTLLYLVKIDCSMT